MAGQPRLVETLQGFVHCFSDELVNLAEVSLIEDGEERHYKLPANQLREKGIEAGDDFFLEIYDDGSGVVVPKVVYGPHQEVEFLTPEELDVLGDAW